MAVAIRCQHGAFFSQALELLAHRKVESVKSVGSSEFLLGTLPTEPILNAQLASLVGKGAGRRGEIAGDLGRPLLWVVGAGRGLNHCTTGIKKRPLQSPHRGHSTHVMSDVTQRRRFTYVLTVVHAR